MIRKSRMRTSMRATASSAEAHCAGAVMCHRIVSVSAASVGGDEDENVVSLCIWCHLHGVHEGRIKAQPRASDVHWELGRTPILVVAGRRKLAAA